jgi:Uma2 family endonuclease
MSVQTARFTVAQYDLMIEAGVFPPGYRAELIEGEIIEMSPIGPPHAACVGRLTQRLILLLQHDVIVWVQNPIRLDDYSEPEPDVTVLKPREDFYAKSLPTPAEVLLLVEVSESSLEFDRKRKLPLYARAGVPEVWIVNLADERVEVFADPADGVYQTTAQVGRGEALQARGVEGLRLGVSEVLG